MQSYRTTKRWLVLVATVLAVFMLALFPTRADAATKSHGAVRFQDQKLSQLQGSLVLYAIRSANFIEKGGKYETAYARFACDTNQVTDLKSSNEKLLQVGIEYNYSTKKNGIYLRSEANKYGKATVTYKYKGKSYTCKVTVKRSPRGDKIASRFYVGNYDFRKGLRDWTSESVPIERSSYLDKQRISISAAKGWKLKDIYAYKYDSKKSKDVYKKIRNGGKVPKGKYTGVLAVFQNTKTNGYQTISAYGTQIHHAFTTKSVTE